jgi:hypothetical protein
VMVSFQPMSFSLSSLRSMLNSQRPKSKIKSIMPSKRLPAVLKISQAWKSMSTIWWTNSTLITTVSFLSRNLPMALDKSRLT